MGCQFLTEEEAELLEAQGLTVKGPFDRELDCLLNCRSPLNPETTLFDQSDFNPSGLALLNQIFPDLISSNCFVFVNFTVPGEGWILEEASSWIVQTSHIGDVPVFTQAKLLVYPGAYLSGPDITQDPTVSVVGGVSIVFVQPSVYKVTLTGIQELVKPGSYYLAMNPIQALTSDNVLEFERSTISSYDKDSWFWNPGGYMGYGSDPVPDSVVTGNPGVDYSYQLKGRVL